MNPLKAAYTGASSAQPAGLSTLAQLRAKLAAGCVNPPESVEALKPEALEPQIPATPPPQPEAPKRARRTKTEMQVDVEPSVAQALSSFSTDDLLAEIYKRVAIKFA